MVSWTPIFSLNIFLRTAATGFMMKWPEWATLPDSTSADKGFLRTTWWTGNPAPCQWSAHTCRETEHLNAAREPGPPENGHFTVQRKTRLLMREHVRGLQSGGASAAWIGNPLGAPDSPPGPRERDRGAAAANWTALASTANWANSFTAGDTTEEERKVYFILNILIVKQTAE